MKRDSSQQNLNREVKESYHGDCKSINFSTRNLAEIDLALMATLRLKIWIHYISVLVRIYLLEGGAGGLE